MVIISPLLTPYAPPSSLSFRITDATIISCPPCIIVHMEGSQNLL